MIGKPRRRAHITRHHFSPSHNETQTRSVVDERQQRSGSKQWLRPLLFAVGGVALLIAGWFLLSGIIAYGKVVDKNHTKKSPLLTFLGDVKPGQLQGEGDGRINILMIGIGGAKHPGGNLADTIIVASFDPKNKEVALLSIPRDLYVPIDGNGSGKINTAHSYGEQSAKKQGGGPAVLKRTVTNILDLPIHYYIRVDFQALVKIVDTLGGVTVKVERPIVDLSYPADNMIDYAPFRLDAGVQKLDGKTALKYVRSRHAAGSEGSDFARAHRQQLLLSAVREKALTAGFLTNPKKLNDIIGILGDHIKTDLSVREMERFVQIWKDVDGSKVLTKVLDNGVNGPLISQSGDSRGSILLPRTGDFSEVQQIAHEIFTDPYLREEKATIGVVNATANGLTGKQVMSLLKSYGYQVTDVTPKDQAKQSKTIIVDYSGKKPYTKKFLETRFKASAKTTKDQTATYDILLTIGTDYTPPKVQVTEKKSLPTATPSIEAANDQN